MGTTGTSAVDRLAGMDFASHNAEVRGMWEAYRAGRPTRVPVILGTNSRYLLLNEATNPNRLQFRPYIEDPDSMFDMQLHFSRWVRFNLLQDSELGLPEVWSIAPDFQNFSEAAWFGCPIEYIDGQVPDTRPAFADAPERVMDKGIPDPFSGVMGQMLEYAEHFRERASRTEFMGRPVQLMPTWCGKSTDGPMTVACNLFGPDFVCTAMLEEPERLRKLLDFITRATIQRRLAWLKRFNQPMPVKNCFFADDSMAMISTAAYVEHILPFHREFFDAVAAKEQRFVHLCGDATRHFKTMLDALQVDTFDTGFPVDFAKLRKELGPNVQILGGPHIELLLRGTPQQVAAETRRILQTGVMEGGRFTLREGNNLAPGTPPENIEAMYRTAREHGRFDPTKA